MRLSSLLRQGYEGPQCRLDLIGEFSLRNGDESHGWLSSQTLQVCVFNDVIRRDEGDPGSLIDAQQSWHWLLATLAAGSGTRLTPDHAARVLTLAASGNADGNGSSLLFALISEGERRVLQLQGWTGGTGDTPGREGDYLGSSGLISNIHEALDIRGRF